MAKLIAIGESRQLAKDAAERLEDFTTAYIKNRGKHEEAYIEAGFTTTNPQDQSKKYLNKHYDYVMSRFKRELGLRNTQYVSLVEEIASNRDERTSDRLKALDMLAKLGGLATTEITIKQEEASTLTPQERQRMIDEYLATKEA
jgi:hypothetical protein